MSIAIPAILAIPAFALIKQQAGEEIFGIYTLSFAIAGYASVFELGLSRAVIREISANHNNLSIGAGVINTAFALMLGLGGVSAAVLVGVSGTMVAVMNVSPYYQADIHTGLIWLALCMPMLLVSQVFLAYFEGLAKFKELSLIKILANTLIVLLPCMAIFITPTFTALMVAMLLARLLVLAISTIWICKTLPIALKLDTVIARRLFGFGGWLTVSAIVGPIMVYFDRFALSAMSGAKNVAFYTAPSELVMRMLSLPGAASRTLFARFSRTPSGNESAIYQLSLLLLGVSATLLALPMWIFAEPLLVAWMGQSFAGEPVWVFRILLIGFIFNAIAQVPFNRLQARGYSYQTAMVHCIELLPYIALLIYLTKQYGIIGVAVAWMVRIIVDTTIFLILDLYYARKCYE